MQCGEGLEQSWEKSRGWAGKGALVGSTVALAGWGQGGKPPPGNKALIWRMGRRVPRAVCAIPALVDSKTFAPAFLSSAKVPAPVAVYCGSVPQTVLGFASQVEAVTPA